MIQSDIRFCKSVTMSVIGAFLGYSCSGIIYGYRRSYRYRLKLGFSGLLEASLGSSGPKWPKEFEMSSWGLSDLGAQKVQNGVEKESK